MEDNEGIDTDGSDQIRDVYKAGGHVKQVRTYQRRPEGLAGIPDDRFWPVNADGKYTSGVVDWPKSKDIEKLEKGGLIKPGPWQETSTGESRDYKLTPEGKRWRDTP